MNEFKKLWNVFNGISSVVGKSQDTVIDEIKIYE